MRILDWLRPASKSPIPEVQDVIDDAKAYLISQTVAPLRHVGRTLAYGLAGALMCAVGIAMALLGVLRVLQGETGGAFVGAWSFAPYLATAVTGICVCAVVALLGLRRYRKRIEAT